MTHHICKNAGAKEAKASTASCDLNYMQLNPNTHTILVYLFITVCLLVWTVCQHLIGSNDKCNVMQYAYAYM